MLNILFALFLLFGIIWTAKKFYAPTKMAQHPELYPVQPDSKVSKKDLGIILSNLQRWKNEGKISREDYDRMTDICLSEMQQIPTKEQPEN